MIDLKPYCWHFETRLELQKPFHQGLYTYACNGHILVRVPREDVTASDGGPNLAEAGLLDVIDNGRAVSPLPLVAVTDPDPCQDCGGTGCDEGYACYSCYGHGTRWRQGCSVWLTPRLAIQPRYYRMLAALPNLLLDLSIDGIATSNARVSAKDAVSFSFDGGRGCLMPLLIAPTPNLNAPCFFNPLNGRAEENNTKIQEPSP